MKKPKPNNGTGKYIFLSYPHKNDEQAVMIIETLQAAGYRVWFDEGLELGARYNQVIAEHIEACEVFMCLLMPGYYQSKYCRMEFTFALEECEKEIIPVFMGDARQIKKSFPAEMRMFLIGVHAFMMNERVDIDDFMHKISNTSMLDVCREEQGATVDRFEALSKAEVNDIIEFGNYWQDAEGKSKSPIKWQVLDKTNTYILVISKYVLDSKPYHEKWEGVTWETCTLRKWLNEGFYNEAFDEEERKRIEIYNAAEHKNPRHDTDPGNPTKDRVFLLSVLEAEKHFHGDKERECFPVAYADAKRIYHYKDRKACWWWLRSPGRSNYFTSVVNYLGDISTSGDSVDFVDVGIRPALWLSLNP